MAEVQAQIIEAIDAVGLRQLLEISTTLSSTLDLKQLLLMVMDTVTDLTGTEAASILLVDKGSGELHFAAATGMKAPEEEMIVPMEGSIAGWIVQNGRPLILDDVQRDARHYTGVDHTTQFVTRDMLGVPLITRGEVIGALEAINKRSGTGYTEQDVTLLQALASQAAIAIENARLFQQTDLIAELMHEVKTPLMAMTTASELLTRQTSSGEQRELLEMIRREINRLSKLTREFLDLSRLESGRVHFAPEPVDLARLVHDVIGLQEAQAALRGITLQQDVSPNLPAVSVDPGRLEQVLLNLVSNAIKYNHENGSVLVCVQLVEQEIQLQVSDTGRGIEAKSLSHLFDRFYRVPDSEGFSEGTGLGLAITKKIVEAHNGRIEVTSELGKGSVFTCYLPLS